MSPGKKENICGDQPEISQVSPTWPVNLYFRLLLNQPRGNAENIQEVSDMQTDVLLHCFISSQIFCDFNKLYEVRNTQEG